MPFINSHSALVHRYDLMLDVLAAYEFKCSEVPGFASGCPEYFKPELLFVVPVTALNCELVVYGTATDAGQFKINTIENWPGGKRRYKVRVNIPEPKFTTISKLKYAMHMRFAKRWSSSLPCFKIDVDTYNGCLELTDEELAKAKHQAHRQAKWEMLTKAKREMLTNLL